MMVRQYFSFLDTFQLSGVLTLSYHISRIDPAARVAAAAALRAISVRASNQFGDGGSNDIWMRRVLPIAYIGRSDQDAGSLFEEVWDEGGQVASLSETGPFATQLEEKILPHITKSLIGALNDVSWDRRVMACKSLNELSKKNILAPGPRTSSYELYTREDLRQRDSIRAESSKSILITCVELIVKSRVWTGKADLVTTTAKIAGTWASLLFQANTQASDRFDSYPISRNDFIWDDLFVDDSWFLNINNNCTEKEDNLTEEDLLVNMNVDEAMSKNVEIDFTKDDEMLNIENDDDNDNEEDGGDETVAKSMLYPVTFSGLCRVFLEQGIKTSPEVMNIIFYSSDALPYRAASLHALSLLLKSHNNEERFDHLYANIAPPLTYVITGNAEVYSHDGHQDFVDHKLPPLIVARAIDCLGSLIWKGIQYNGENVYTNTQLLAKLFSKNCGEAQPAWTVREASAIAASKLALCVNCSELTKIELLNDFIQCSESCVKDKKFWKVRFAKLKILSCLCNRSVNGNDANEKQLILEALLPLKEKMISTAKSHLNDTESSVSAISSEVISAMAWWP